MFDFVMGTLAGRSASDTICVADSNDIVDPPIARVVSHFFEKFDRIGHAAQSISNRIDKN